MGLESRQSYRRSLSRSPDGGVNRTFVASTAEPTGSPPQYREVPLSSTSEETKSSVASLKLEGDITPVACDIRKPLPESEESSDTPSIIKDRAEYRHQDASDDEDKGGGDREKGEEDSPFEMVRSAVSNSDDPTLPSLTFRTIVLGTGFTALLSFVNQFYWFRDNPIALNMLVVQLLCYPLGLGMAMVLPRRQFNIFGFRWSMNPGKFNIKEHVLISLMSNTSAFTALAVDVFAILRLHYDAAFSKFASFLLLASGQVFAYSLAGLAHKLLVKPAAMIWPASLVNVALFRTFHDHADRSGGMSRIRFFWIFFAVSFFWYFVPGYLIQALSSISILCLAAPGNHLAQLIGDGRKGLGILSFSLDWSIFSNAFLLTPIATPFWAALNLFVGFLLTFWIALPIAYFKNMWNSATLPIYGSGIYTTSGETYNTSKVMVNNSYSEDAYQAYSPLRMPLEFSWAYGFGFASLMSILVHIAIYNGREIIEHVKESHGKLDDIHSKLMRTYPTSKIWWYAVILAVSAVVGIVTGVAFKIGVPWWSFILAYVIALVLIVPVGIVQAVTNRQPSLSLVAELLSGLVLQGRPSGFAVLKLYGHCSLAQALSYCQDLKLAHYMKIPPRHVFVLQLAGLLISVIVQSMLTFWLLDSVPNMCDPDHYPWTCRTTNVVYSASVIWGFIGPVRVFGSGSPYSPLLWGILIGALLPLPVYLFQRLFPRVEWLQYVYVPVIVSGIVGLPPAPPVDFPMWFIFGFVFNFIVYRYRHAWWKRFNFTLSAALDSGLALSGIFIYFTLVQNGVRIDWWGNRQDEMCPLSSKPWISQDQDL